MRHEKLANLRERLVGLESCLVAFSAGVDSTFLLKVAVDVLGRERVLAVTAISPSLAREEAEEAPPPQQWVAAQMQSAESVLFKPRCEFCHTLTYAPDKLPDVALTAIPIRWLPHSTFDHGVHRMVACTECHKATQSQKTADVLLPSIATCRECHRTAGGARSGCVECHLYHDKTQERDLNGPFTVRELVMGAPPPRGAAAPRSETMDAEGGPMRGKVSGYRRQ